MDRPFLSLRSGPRSMSRIRKVAVCLGVLIVLLPLVGAAADPVSAFQESEADEVVIFVLDLSGSMNEPFDEGQTKLDVAKAAFVEAFANVSPDALVGLRTYGDQVASTSPENRELSCTTDTRLVSPVAALQRDELIGQVGDFAALGDTPIGLALAEARNDIPVGATGTIVVFSDGRDECFDADLDGDATVGPSYGEDPCEIARQMTDGDSNVERVVTVGFRADATAERELRCIADSTGGTYTAIQTPTDARDVLPELLVSLSAPREAARQVGRSINGTTAIDTAPDMVRLDEVDANQVLYTDSIDMNAERVYRVAEYGPGGGTFTATVFGLPAEEGIEFDVRVFVPDLQQLFFKGEFGDFNAGLPERQTASIRCTNCSVGGSGREVFWILSLKSPDPSLTGSYELELLTEGPGFGGDPVTCTAPQACFYPNEIRMAEDALADVQSELDAGVGELAPQELVDERDRLRAEIRLADETIESANAEAEELEARIATAPVKSNSFIIPLLMVLAGLALLFAPLGKLLGGRSSKENDETEVELDAPPIPAAPSVSSTPGGGPSLDVGPAPAISPARQREGNSWDAELEAAKAALAEQRPARRASSPEAAAADTAQDQHPEAIAAAERLAVVQANEAREAAEAPVEKPKTGLTQAMAAAEQAQAQTAAEPAQPEQPVQAPNQGWYEDPVQAGQYRWWDGAGWTSHTSPDGQGVPE